MKLTQTALLFLGIASLAGCVQPSTRAADSAVDGYAKVFAPSDPRQLGAIELRAPKLETDDQGRTLNLSSGDEPRAVRLRLLDENDWQGAKRVSATAAPSTDSLDGETLLSSLRGGVLASSAEIRREAGKVTLRLHDVAFAPAAPTAEWLDVVVDFHDPNLLNYGTIAMLQQSGSPSIVRISGD
jgi:hypothetical protein